MIVFVQFLPRAVVIAIEDSGSFLPRNWAQGSSCNPQTASAKNVQNGYPQAFGACPGNQRVCASMPKI